MTSPTWRSKVRMCRRRAPGFRFRSKVAGRYGARPAPSAARMANSRCREVERASNKFATLAQPISRTSPTAPKSRRICGRKSPTKASSAGWARKVRLLFESGYSFARRAPSASISLLARSSVTPGFKRAMLARKCAPRCSVMALSSSRDVDVAESVVQTCGGSSSSGKYES